MSTISSVVTPADFAGPLPVSSRAGRNGSVSSARSRPRPLVTPDDFLAYVRPDLEAIEALMNTQVGSDVRTVFRLMHHLMRAGGKRLRPAMVALAARCASTDADPHRIAVVGAAVEFVHMATLVHDDVVDNTATRRGKPTANAIFGNGVAVLSGDYILARSMRLLAEVGDLRLIRAISEITVEMSEGEVMEIGATGRYDLPLADYYEILRKKTAVFVEGCCRCGAIIAEAGETTETALGDYGYQLGMAFQIADDLLDYTGDPAITGKPRGSDLRDGRATLPFLTALATVTPGERECLLHAFGNADLTDDDIARVCCILDGRGAFESTRAIAHAHVDKANTALRTLSASPARDCLAALTEYVVQRDR